MIRCLILTLLFCSSISAQDLYAKYGVDCNGWKRNDSEVRRVESLLPKVWRQEFSRLPKLYSDDDEDRTVLAYRFLMSALGTSEPLPSRKQEIGSCVGFATAATIDHLQGTLMARGPPAIFVPTNASALYGLGRMHAGQLGSWDGSTGAWSVKAMLDLGTLHQKKYGQHDLTREYGRLSKQFAARGLPSELVEAAAEHKVKAAARIKSIHEARAAIQSGYMILVCSNVGFQNGRGGWITTRDQDGFANPSGSWNHAMMFVAYRGKDSGRQGFLCRNSWGSEDRSSNQGWIRGPPWPEDMPLGSFWVEPKVVQRMIQQGDTWALSDYEGFRKREIPWSEVFQWGGRD